MDLLARDLGTRWRGADSGLPLFGVGSKSIIRSKYLLLFVV